jgi:uncharacterized membrane protein
MAGSVIVNARPALLAAALALAACQRQDPNGEPAAPPAEAPPAAAAAATTVSDFSQPITAQGTEPFWSLTIDGVRFRLRRPQQPAVVAQAPGAAIQPGRAVWIAQTADGQQMTVTLYVRPCSDGMSDVKYPMTAEVVLLNQTLRGCATKTAELPRETR